MRFLLSPRIFQVALASAPSFSSLVSGGEADVTQGLRGTCC